MYLVHRHLLCLLHFSPVTFHLSLSLCLLQMTFFFAFIFMFFVFWRPQEWLVQWMFGWPILDVVAVMGILALIAEKDAGHIRPPTSSVHFFMLIGLFFATLMSHVANTYWQGMLDTIEPVFKVCLFTALLIVSLDRPSRLKWVGILFVGMACVMAWHALLQERTGAGFIGEPPMKIGAVGNRPAHTRSLFFGIFGDPNDLAQILGAAMPFAFALTWRLRFVSFSLGCAIAYFLVLGILSTHSRGGQVGLVVTGSMMLAMILPARWAPFAMGAVGATALFMCTLAAGYLDASAFERVVFWGMANWMFKSHLIFGIGWGMFWMVASDRAAHNAFVSAYTTMGLFGYWFWFGLIFVGAMGTWRSRGALKGEESRENRWLRRFAGLTLASTCGFCASSYFLSRDFVYPLFFLMALMAAITMVTERTISEREGKPVRLLDTGRDVIGWVTVASLGSVAYIYTSILLLNKAYGG